MRIPGHGVGSRSTGLATAGQQRWLGGGSDWIAVLHRDWAERARVWWQDKGHLMASSGCVDMWVRGCVGVCVCGCVCARACVYLFLRLLAWVGLERTM